MHLCARQCLEHAHETIDASPNHVGFLVAALCAVRAKAKTRWACCNFSWNRATLPRNMLTGPLSWRGLGQARLPFDSLS